MRFARALRFGMILSTGLLLTACSSPPPSTFDLTAPRDGLASGRGRGLLVVAEPQALAALDSNRILILTRDGGIALLRQRRQALDSHSGRGERAQQRRTSGALRRA